MRCRYREKIYRCGDYLEAEIYPVFHEGAGKSRRKARYKPTSAMQARLNQRTAEKKLARLLNENFTGEDIEMTLTYTPDELPDSYEEAAKDAQNYIRRVKRLYSKRGIADLKYIVVPGGSERYHFHIIMTGGVDREELERLWKRGYANSKRLKFLSGGITGLAHYIARQFSDEELQEDLFCGFEVNEETGEVTESDEKPKRQKNRRRWSCSKNLVRPLPEIRDGRLSAKRVTELATFDREDRRTYEKLYPGYVLTSAKPYYNPENGGYYIQVMMRKERMRN